MPERIIINSRGVVTIPAALRKAFGLEAGEELFAEETPEGILLRPAVSVPIEIYTEERIAEFAQDEPEIEALLPELE
ncbi:AbrB/MazE/SpoVT family DNA-binding domain-containing protein [Engelhardtia mirabilis]|uniref:SpoVT / AbrB like domain protein n=1 Tax=Engelhardtia mirabilis TaxID=2528011 RepID=A0A518BT46_9BACT|nr:SpoVT / AbrB like domain protein [Planctomycetes bacterium Pla133]QDV04470.1 SpoVT / AbrB like domain protein [Planctomycetes bacterium Pla86]